MTRDARSFRTRRLLLSGAAATLFAPRLHAAAIVPTLRVGLLPFGTVQWEIELLRRRGLDAAEGLRVEPVPLASPEASRLAFLSGSVDTIVQDLLFAARLKAEGRTVLFLPQSSTEGELIARPACAVMTLADLKGKTIGVAGGPLDKNWLFLRVDALERARLDLSKEAKIVFGAAPLLGAKLESGELDCALLYWSQGARLRAKGYRRVTSTEEILVDLGARGQVAVGGYLFDGRTGRDTLLGFRKALRAAQRLLLDSPAAWDAIRPLMKAPDEPTFAALRSAYLRGIPRKGRAAEIADAGAFFDVIRRIGGREILGPATELPSDLYVDPELYG